jgi:hypothetical protein
MFRHQSFVILAGAALWLLLVVAGFSALQHYAAQAGLLREPAQSAVTWLQQHRQPGRPLLVMAIHARCPCTDASLSELADFLARSRGGCDALLLRYVPALSAVSDWPAGDDRRELGGTSVPVMADPDGKIAAQLGAFTSGSVVFLDAAGEVRFHGGLTLARGHRGRSPAQDALLALLDHRTDEHFLTTAPVYGCALGAVPDQTEVCR